MEDLPGPVAIVGLGAVGRRLALGWKRAGVRVLGFTRSPASRELARAEGIDAEVDLATALAHATAIVFCVRDSDLAAAAEQVARELERAPRSPREAPVCLHTCGAGDRGALGALARAGCETGMLHPLAAFAPEGPGPEFNAISCAVAGAPRARAVAGELARALGAAVLRLQPDDAAAATYHAAAALLSNGTVAVAAMAFELARSACVDEGEARRAFLALLRGTVANLEQLDPGRALTGPIARGDVDTVREHVRALRARKNAAVRELVAGQSTLEGAGDADAYVLYLQLGTRMARIAWTEGRIDGERYLEILRALEP